MKKSRRVFVLLLNILLILIGIGSIIISIAFAQAFKDKGNLGQDAGMLIDACHNYFLYFGLAFIIGGVFNLVLIPWRSEP
jgi:hypothetical protein